MGSADAVQSSSLRPAGDDAYGDQDRRWRNALRPAYHRCPRCRMYADIRGVRVRSRYEDPNDRYGHPAGDQILRDFAVMLRQCSRATDTPARYAGDEFLLVLPDTDLEGVAKMAMRIREQLAAAKFEQAPGLRSTVSLGAA